ncbi:MAG: MaoC family dehydratase [Chloroflexota bacterium]
MTTTICGPGGLKAIEGNELPPSSWLEITQDQVTAFADCTDDRQWIHVDPERAKAGPFGGTIAHGFLSLSLITHFWEEILKVEGFRMTLNYGLNRVRFPAPLPVGSRVRAIFQVAEVTEVAGGLQARCQVTIEREGQAKPVCVAETLVRFYV